MVAVAVDKRGALDPVGRQPLIGGKFVCDSVPERRAGSGRTKCDAARNDGRVQNAAGGLERIDELRAAAVVEVADDGAVRAPLQLQAVPRIRRKSLVDGGDSRHRGAPRRANGKSHLNELELTRIGRGHKRQCSPHRPGAQILGGDMQIILHGHGSNNGRMASAVARFDEVTVSAPRILLAPRYSGHDTNLRCIRSVRHLDYNGSIATIELLTMSPEAVG